MPLSLDSHVPIQVLYLEVRVLSVLVNLSPQRVFEICHIDGQLLFDSVVDEFGQVPLLPVGELSLVEGSSGVFDVWIVQSVQVLGVN